MAAEREFVVVLAWGRSRRLNLEMSDDPQR